MSQQPTYKRLKQVVFAGIIALLFLPMIQHKFRFFEETPLKGSYELSTKLKLNQTNWFSGKYQERQDLYITEHTGFRPGWVRFYNQWNYSLFAKSYANGVVIGKDDFLYEENYIRTYYGMDFIGKSKINTLTKQWKSVQDTLKRKGIDLVVVFAPGKGSFYPEYIPHRYKNLRVNKTNYSEFKKQFDNHAVNYIDMHSWFRSMKRTAKYPLFSKTGIHWSAYGQWFVLDSLSKFVSARCNTTIPYFVLDSMEVSDSAMLGDNDIAVGLNMFKEIPDLKLAYPQFHPNRNVTPNDPKVLVIGDSFYWGLFNSNMSHSLFNNGEFWYYNKQIYPATYQKETLVKNQHLNRKLEENKVVFLIMTDASLNRFGFGFLEMACKEYGIPM